MPLASPPGLTEGDDVVEEIVALRDRSLNVVRPRDAEALLHDEAFEHEEYLPYWAELWPSGLALARRVSARALRGARTVELGCGLGLPSVAAALAGARVLATDWSPEALPFVIENARRNDAEVEVALGVWESPGPLLARAPFDLVLAADVLYERRNVPALLDLLPRLVTPRGEVWIADPGRPPAPDFLAAAVKHFSVASVADAQHPMVMHHTLRALAPGPPG
jgi:predicted nicotinamide N-methyase